MPPKKLVQDLPEAVDEYKKLLDSRGGVNVDNLKASDPERYKAISSAHLKSLQTHALKMEALAEYMLRPESGGCVGRNFASRTARHKDRTREIWITETTLAGPHYLNSTTEAALAVQSCLSKEHHNAGLRNAGVKLYQWFEQVKDNDVVVESGVEAAKTADMTEADYSAVKKHMENLNNPGEDKPHRAQPGGKRPKLDTEMTPVQKAIHMLKQWQAEG